jgi:hypothetical protein
MTKKPGNRLILLYLLKRPSFNSAQLYRFEFFVKLPLMPGARKRDYDATIETLNRS